jgi:predicted DCC family thiol-disulfide oxidoreductase YuxK
VRWVEARHAASRVLAIPSQRPGVGERYGLSREETDREVWAIDRTGRRWGGAAAISRTLRQLGGAWPIVAALYAVPPIAWLADRLYRWVAAHRGWLSRVWSSTPACEEADGGCAER